MSGDRKAAQKGDAEHRRAAKAPAALRAGARTGDDGVSVLPGQLHKIGEDVNEVLDVIPAILPVLRTIRPKYACRCTDGLMQAKALSRLIEGGMVSTALVAYVPVSKFAWHLPLYWQVPILAGLGVHVDRSTLALWVKRVAWWLKNPTSCGCGRSKRRHGYPAMRRRCR
jgi:transposase